MTTWTPSPREAVLVTALQQVAQQAIAGANRPLGATESEFRSLARMAEHGIAEAASIPAAAADALGDAAGEMLDLMTDALFVHIYCDGEPIPANCGHVAAIQRLAAALGRPPVAIETRPVWAYSATFADRNGERRSYSTEVLAPDREEALARGRAELDLCHRGAAHVAAAVSLVAGEAAAAAVGLPTCDNCLRSVGAAIEDEYGNWQCKACGSLQTNGLYR